MSAGPFPVREALGEELGNILTALGFSFEERKNNQLTGGTRCIGRPKMEICVSALDALCFARKTLYR